MDVEVATLMLQADRLNDRCLWLATLLTSPEALELAVVQHTLGDPADLISNWAVLTDLGGDTLNACIPVLVIDCISDSMPVWLQVL